MLMLPQLALYAERSIQLQIGQMADAFHAWNTEYDQQPHSAWLRRAMQQD